MNLVHAHVEVGGCPTLSLYATGQDAIIRNADPLKVTCNVCLANYGGAPEAGVGSMNEPVAWVQCGDACPCCGENHVNTARIRADATAAMSAAMCVHDVALDRWCNQCAQADGKGCPEHGGLECIRCCFWGLTVHVERQVKS